MGILWGFYVRFVGAMCLHMSVLCPFMSVLWDFYVRFMSGANVIKIASLCNVCVGLRSVYADLRSVCADLCCVCAAYCRLDMRKVPLMPVFLKELRLCCGIFFLLACVLGVGYAICKFTKMCCGGQ